jgi:hypothetical protein
MRKEYQKPALRTVEGQLGVFGEYGSTPGQNDHTGGGGQRHGDLHSWWDKLGQ